jgi:penicillin G amidase
VLKTLRILGWLFVVAIVAAGTVVWWVVYRPLPQVDGRLELPGLRKEVTVERDAWGVPYIRASSLEDMAEAQGYVMAQDRLWQMDLLRRVGRGELSEILGPATLKIDRRFRVLRLGRAAERDVSLMPPEAKLAIEAYARGVNRFITTHLDNLPLEFRLLRYKPQPWRPADTLVIAGYMYETLTDTWERELDRAKVTERVGTERAKDLYSEDAAMDHYVIGDPNVTDDGWQRDGAGLSKEDRDDPPPENILKANGPGVSLNDCPDLTSALAAPVVDWLGEAQRDIREGLGSNNWVVSGAHTSAGKPLLANDTHLELSIPPIWYEVHLTAPGWNVKGFSLPGAPMVIIGHNDRIAWGFTNNGAAVQDLYIETLNPANEEQYLVRGAWTKAEVDDEVIHVKGRPDEHMKMLVTRHGPVVHREGNQAYALRWTATEPGGLANTYTLMGKAENWSQFLDVMKDVWGPAQNAVYADLDGNIGYVMAARVPIRKEAHGEVPEPGDTDDHEWTGYIPFDELPRALNPASGLIVTANARVVGPAYKEYLTDRWEEPYRTARIWDLLRDKHDLRPEDMLNVQTDTYSYPDVFLAKQLAAAVKNSEPKDERTRRLIAMAKDWNGMADANSVVVSFLEETRGEALRRVLEPFLGDETPLYRWRSIAFLQRILTERPAKWLAKPYKNYDELLVAAADDAVKELTSRTGSARIEDWQWKRFDSLDMLHPLGQEGFLKTLLSISNKPQSGTVFSPWAATPHHGPAMRFVADLANWDDSIMLIPAGQSGQLGSSHYTDQFPYWYKGKSITEPFSEAAETKIRKHTLKLEPAN